jgi:outer membrane protein assembly factor BamB
MKSFCMMSRFSCLILFNILFATFLYPQMEPTARLTFDGDVQWIQLSSLGFPIISTTSGVYGIDPLENKVSWHHTSMRFPSRDSYREIEGTPYFALSDDRSLFVVEPVEGSLLFSSAATGLTELTNYFFLYRSNCLLAVGYKDEERSPYLAMIDLATGEKKWMRENEFGQITGCLDLGENEFLVSSLFYLYRIDIQTGEVIWKKHVDPQMDAANSKAMQGLLSLLEKGAGKTDLTDNLKAEMIQTNLFPDGIFFNV